MKLIKLKFHIWFKYGLKAQKFQKQHALKGQKLLAQGIALGITAANLSPCKGKSFKTQAIFKAFALTGRLADCHYTQGDALG